MLRQVVRHSERSFSKFAARTSAVHHRRVLTTQQTHFHSWFDGILANAPKGFGKYYPGGDKDKESSSSSSGSSAKKEEDAAEEKEDSEPSKSSKKSKFNADSKKDSKKGSGSGPNFNGMPPPWKDMGGMLFVMTSFALLFNMVSGQQRNGREISWQEFQTHLLESGNVDRIIVSNKNIARVMVRRGAPNAEADMNGLETQPSADAYADPWNSQQSSPGEFRDGHDDGAKETTPKGRYPSIGLPHNLSSPYYFNIGSVDVFEKKLEEAQRNLSIAPRDFIPVQYVNETDYLSNMLSYGMLLALVGGVAMMAAQRFGGAGGGGGPGGIFSIGKSKAKKLGKEKVTTRFKDVAGCDEAKLEVMEFVDFLKEPKRFTDLGAKIPKGALLCGPPGTGKTLLARATAGEANVPFFSISGSDFVEMFVGVGPARVRDMFKDARNAAPCIIFIDEIDAVGRQRGKGNFAGGNDERENTLNQLLVEMDGFDATTNIVVLAGTNRADVLDQALLRPGRFDRQIQVEKPDIAGRKAIFEVHLKGINLHGETEEYSGRLAALTPGFSGADIANICNEAAIVAARRNKKSIDMFDFEAATDRVIGGLESKKIMSPEEKRIVAFHEAGHAVAGWYLEHADPLLKVTIVPRGNGALGYAQYLPKEIFLRTKEQILDMVCMALAGRAAEQVMFGKYTTGAADDLRRVTQIVYQMVQVYGMNECVGQLSFPQDNQGGFPAEKPYSNATAEKMDEEVRELVKTAYERSIALMEEKRPQLTLVAEYLLKEETITNADVTNLIGARPHSPGADYEKYVNANVDWRKADDATSSESDATTTAEEDNETDGNPGGAIPSPAFMKDEKPKDI